MNNGRLSRDIDAKPDSSWLEALVVVFHKTVDNLKFLPT